MEFALTRRFNLKKSLLEPDSRLRKLLESALRLPSLLEPALRAIVLITLSTSIVFAQGIQLSPEQQQMLNQLPPAQRQQAMDAIRQLQSQQNAGGIQGLQSIREEPSAVQTAR
jgi:hypothetical protein